MVSKELDERYMPQAYKHLLQREQAMVWAFLRNTDKVLDVGCGDGRIIPYVAPLVRQYFGIDPNENRITEAQKLQEAFSNILLYVKDASNISDLFVRGNVEKSIALFGVLGCVQDDRTVLQQMARVTTDAVLFTVMKKGALALRKEYYENVGIEYHVDENETIKSDVWGSMRAYTPEDILNLVDAVHLRVKGLEQVADLGYIVTATKPGQSGE